MALLRKLMASLALFASPFTNASPEARPASGTRPSPACTDAEHHQFDFWIGEWQVTGGHDGNTPEGSNTITRVASGCALLEHWRSVRGSEGMSLNAYDTTRQQWTQFWVCGDGGILHLRGGIRDGAMVMNGELASAAGGSQLQRITWTPRDDGSVEQRWDVSDDNGSSWSISFLGIYRRVQGKQAS